MDRSILLVKILRLRSYSEWIPATGYARLTVDGHLLTVNVGDRIRIFANIRKIQPATNPGEFDFRNHARAERRLCQLRSPYPNCVSVLKRAEEYGWLALVRKYRWHCHRQLQERMDPEVADLAAALLLGLRQSMPKDRIDAFFLTGTMHLLAISGLHIGILAFGFFFAARRGVLPFRFAVLSAMLFTFGYAIFTGNQPPVLRATILVQVVCFGWLMRRQVASFNSLALAGCLVLIGNPAELFRVGAQLSFVAVAALSWLASRQPKNLREDPLERLIWRSRPWYHRTLLRLLQAAKAMFVASLFVWLMTLPLVMFRFHLITPFAIVLNILLWPAIATALFSGMAVVLFGDLLPAAATPASGLCNISLLSLQQAVSYASNLIGSHFWVAGPNVVQTLVFYLGVTLFAMSRFQPNRRWALVLLCAWFSWPLCWDSIRRRVASPQDVNITFVNVGHGTAVLVQLPNQRNILYDCGHMGFPDPAVHSISGVLWANRIHHLDAVILSHGDADHYNALPGLLERFSCGIVYVGPGMFEQKSDSLGALRDSIRFRQVPIRTVSVGDALQTMCEAKVSFLHPPNSIGFRSDNAKSIVALIEFQGRRLLLPGDLELDGLQHFVTQTSSDCDVLMAPHHGSLSSQTEIIVDWSTPETTIISAGVKNQPQTIMEFFQNFDHRVFHTAIHGAVFVKLNDALRIHPYLKTGAD